jgi:hypothetical protein
MAAPHIILLHPQVAQVAEHQEVIQYLIQLLLLVAVVVAVVTTTLVLILDQAQTAVLVAVVVADHYMHNLVELAIHLLYLLAKETMVEMDLVMQVQDMVVEAEAVQVLLVLLEQVALVGMVVLE